MRKTLKYFARKYVDWVIRLGRVRFSLLGIALLAVLAVFTQIALSLFIIGEIYWDDLLRSISFGLISAPFVIYFSTLLVEKLELSRLDLAKSVTDLQAEIKERISAEQRLAQINRDKTTLLETISHELRTPLNGIIGLSRILLEGDLSDTQRNYLKTIHISAISLGHIFADIIDLEKIDGLRIELHPHESDFSQLLDNITNIGMLLAEQKRLHFELKCGRNLPRFLLLDDTRLNQVLWNLLSNAIKFTERGGITLDVRRTDEDMLTFMVEDSGCGIPATEIDKIFTLYYQIPEDGDIRQGGSGIGLAVSKSIAGLMGGDLTVSSTMGHGSRFTLTIKIKEIARPTEAAVASETMALNVLLVEDIELNVVVAKSVLEKLGYRVDVAMTGREAIEKFKQHQYDVIFLDIQLPDMNGFQVAQHLRRHYERGDYDYLPLLIALTANVMHGKAEYRRQGMDDVLSKPLSVKALAQCLAGYFTDESNGMAVAESSEIVKSAVDSELDFLLLNELIDMLGVQTVMDNVALFKQMMPAYVSELKTVRSDMSAKREVAAVAHKIKGAAASIGLLRIQRLAQHAQQDDLPEWPGHIDEWITAIDTQWAEETEKLTQWLAVKKS